MLNTKLAISPRSLFVTCRVNDERSGGMASGNASRHLFVKCQILKQVLMKDLKVIFNADPF